MRSLIFIFCLAILGGVSCGRHGTSPRLDISGEWQFALDPEDRGVEEGWAGKQFAQTIQLPGSLQEQGYGNDPYLDTQWTGGVADSAFYKEAKYEKYRQRDNFKIPFWLQPDKHYVGVAWYKKQIDIPQNWTGREIVLELERTHWETTVYVNGEELGRNDALQTPHRYVIPQSGKIDLAIRVDNRVNVPVGVSAHSVSDQTQSNWNGIVGELSITARPSVHIDDVQIYPDLASRRAKVVVKLAGKADKGVRAKIKVEGFNSAKKAKPITVEAAIDGTVLETYVDMGENMLTWSEFEPNLYKATVKISSPAGDDLREVTFGMREIAAEGRRLAVNGTPVFLRGTLECCIFPLTGYPAMQPEYWEKIYRRVREYGMNHVRFHSWCPPKVAFDVADREGIYLQVECGVWANVNIGDGEYLDRWIFAEGDRILKEYGNHPSFCLMSHGNEPSGGNQVQYLSSLIDHWKANDSRRVYSSSGGWPYVDNADYWNTPEPRIQGYGQNLHSIINAEAPRTDYDFRNVIQSVQMPIVAHEIGDWCAYPNFKEIDKYTGVLKAKNFEIFRETLGENHLGDLAEDFLYASGRLQVLCYKADIEAALRTPEFAGFQQLALLDFPGQGTALVGVLDTFWDPKGYVDGAEYSSFCGSTVPLARLKKMVWNSGETFNAQLETAHFGRSALKDAQVIWEISDVAGTVLQRGEVTKDIPVDNCNFISDVNFDLSGIKSPSKLVLAVRIPAAKAENRWNIWVYPQTRAKVDNAPVVTKSVDEALARAAAGENVLYFIPKGSLKPEKGGKIVVGFSSIFWNTAWTLMQEPHEFGVYCNPEHPVFAEFPTDMHTDYQWWDVERYTSAIDMTDFPAGYRPVVHLIDDWFTNRKLGILFETKVGRGKMMVSGVDFEKDMTDRPASSQLKHSIEKYMASDRFMPSEEIEIELIKALVK